MNRAIVSILAVVLIGLQEAPAQLVKTFGFKAAVTSADQEFKYSQFSTELNMKRRVGFNVGVFLEWFDMPYLSMISQVEYAERGMGMEFMVTGSEGPEVLGTKTVFSRVDYISIPILLKFRLQYSLITPYLLAGPRLDILAGYQSPDGVFNSVYDKFKHTTLGGSVAVGVQIQSLLPVTILTEARFNLDFEDSYETNLLKVRNNSFDFWLGVAF
jgi:hypothetical protein